MSETVHYNRPDAEPVNHEKIQQYEARLVGFQRAAELEAVASDSNDVQLARGIANIRRAESALVRNNVYSHRLDSLLDDSETSGLHTVEDVQTSLRTDITELESVNDGVLSDAAIDMVKQFRVEARQKIADKVRQGGEGEEADHYRLVASKLIAGEI